MQQGLRSQTALVSLLCHFPDAQHSASYSAFPCLHSLIYKMRTIPRLLCILKALTEESAQNGAWHTLNAPQASAASYLWVWYEALVPFASGMGFLIFARDAALVLSTKSQPTELRSASCLLLPYLGSCQPPPGCLPASSGEADCSLC